MKASTKKLVVFVIVATIATLILATMASAGGKNDWRAIHGQYSGTSVVTCNSYKPGNTFAGTNISTQLSIYTFNGDGTGTVEGKFVMLGVTPTASESAFDLAWDFTYEVADDGKITMYVVPGTDKFNIGNFILFRYTGEIAPESGGFSVDHKTLTIGTEGVAITDLTMYDDTTRKVKCNVSRVLIRVDE